VSVPGDFQKLRRQFTRKQSGMVLMKGDYRFWVRQSEKKGVPSDFDEVSGS